MPVDHAEVARISARAIAAVGADASCCGTVRRAFRHLQAMRQVPGASLDLNLAAAEHYMFARLLVCSGDVSRGQMRVLVRSYDLKKRLDLAFGDPNSEAVTDNPVSPPDSDVEAWGLRGSTDGENDHSRCNSDVEPPFWRSLSEVFGPGRGYGPY